MGRIHVSWTTCVTTMLVLIMVVRLAVDLKLMRARAVVEHASTSSSSTFRPFLVHAKVPEGEAPTLTTKVSTSASSSSSSSSSFASSSAVASSSVKTLSVLHCVDGVQASFARSLCSALDRVGSPHLRARCSNSSHAPDVWVLNEGPNSCTGGAPSSLPVERQLHVRMHSQAECEHQATILWTGRNPPGKCPNVLHVAPALLQRMIAGLEFAELAATTKSRNAARPPGKMCIINIGHPCSEEVRKVISTLGCEGSCGSAAIDVAEFKFIVVSEPQRREGFVSRTLIDA